MSRHPFSRRTHRRKRTGGLHITKARQEIGHRTALNLSAASRYSSGRRPDPTKPLWTPTPEPDMEAELARIASWLSKANVSSCPPPSSS